MEEDFDMLKLESQEMEISEAAVENSSENIRPEKVGQGEVEDSQDVKFYPPMYIQRYCRVTDILDELLPKDDVLKTVLDVGCGEFSMHVYLSKLRGVGKLVYLDVDEYLLNSNSRKLKPLIIDHIQKRETPLRVEAYAGSIIKVDPDVLSSVYAVVGIEIVEHLDPHVLTGFVDSVFGVIKPEIVILTTPNCEFNVVFNLPPGKFRHWDHRFEWTRHEFESWCKYVCKMHPLYSYTTEGVGAGEPETADFGCVTQLAIFRKIDQSLNNQMSDLNVQDIQNLTPDDKSYEGIVQKNCYKLITELDYPFFCDNTPMDERIVREFKCYLRCYLLTPFRIDEYIEKEIRLIDFPLTSILGIHGIPNTVTVDQIRSALETAGYAMMLTNDKGEEEVRVIIPVPEISGDDRSSIESDNDLDDSECAGTLDTFAIPCVDESEEW